MESYTQEQLALYSALQKQPVKCRLEMKMHTMIYTI